MAPKRDPAREAFESVAPSSSTIRSARSKMHAACTTCLKREGPGVELRRCGKCKSICYCSKQCQTKNWPEHKKMCGGMDGTGLLRLVQALWANDLLTVYLQACCVLDCDLRHNPRADKPFMARIDFGIEPTDVVDLFKIFFGESPPTKLKAMLQLNGFTASRTADVASLPYRAKEIWLQEWARADAHGLKEQPLGLVEMCNGDGGLGIMLPLLIDKAAMRLVDNSEPWEIHTPGIGQVTHRPFTIETCMEFVNSHIRQDKKNQLRLRADMRPRALTGSPRVCCAKKWPGSLSTSRWSHATI
ncbi:hypothetical protein C8R43DRAFT_1004439 [Mycena crocata]|nr:hypothetical protein C8R43DRAFT_1004439 [Mycena crocata]